MVHFIKMKVYSPLMAAAVLLLMLPGSRTIAMESELSLGLGIVQESRYSGSNDNVFSPVPIIDYQLGDYLFASTLRGIGAEFYYPVGEYQLYASTAFNYDSGRDEKEDEGGIFRKSKKKIIKKLRGMGDIKGTVTNILGIGIADNRGDQLDIGVELPLSQSKRGERYYINLAVPLFEWDTHQVILDSQVWYASKKYMQTYYGVTAQQSERSGHRQYSPKAGFESANASLIWHWQLAPSWRLSALAGVEHLFNTPGRSAIVERKTAPISAVGITYIF